jgi:hypothetical protein
MSEPTADRILPAGAFPNVDESASNQPSPAAAPTEEPAR